MRHLLFIPAFLICATSALCQDDPGEVFLSLTRTAEPLTSLPTNATIVTQSQIQERNARDLGELLENETGLQYGRHGTLGQLRTISFRGASAAQTLVLMDGRRVNNTSSGFVDLSAIPMGNIERIEIIRGAASSIYGSNAFGGVVNIITRRPSTDAPMLSLTASNGSFGSRNYQMNFNIVRKKTGAAMSVSRNLSDGWRRNEDFDGNSFAFRLDHETESLGSFDLTASALRSDLGTPGPLSDPADPYKPLTTDLYNGAREIQASSPDARQTQTRRYALVSHSIPVGSTLLKSSLFASNDRKGYRYPAAGIDAIYDELNFGTQVQATLRSGLTAGGEWWEEKYRQTQVQTNIDRTDRDRITTAFFVQHKISQGRLSFIPNLRCDANSIFGNVVSPKITAVYAVEDDLKISANAGKAWRAPTFDDLYWPTESYTDAGVTYITDGNPSLVPEEALSYDLGVQHCGKNYRGGVTLFRIDSRNLITWKGRLGVNSSIYRPENVSSALLEGAEFEFNHTIGGGLYQTLNYTYLYAEDIELKQPLDYRPQDTLHYSLAYHTPFAMRISAGLTYVSRQFDSVYNLYLPGYSVVTLGISQTLSDLEIWLNADNLTDMRYQTRLGYPLPGIVISAGLRLKIWG